MANYCHCCLSEIQPNLQECPFCHTRIPYRSADVRDCPPGTLLQDRYLIGKVLGRGGFGVTYLALDLQTREKVCIKECNLVHCTYRDPYHPTRILPKDDSDSPEIFETAKQNLAKECDALRTLQDIPEVVHYVDDFACNNTTYLVMEYLDGRDLRRYVRDERGASNPLSMDEAAYYTICLLNILTDVHAKGLLHRDISPDNIYLCRDKTIKLIDFGTSRALNTSNATGFEKHGYTAPEMLAHDKQGDYTDVYSAGAVLYFLLTGKKPDTPADGKPLAPPPEHRTTPELTAIFTKAVQRDPKNRYQSAAEMAADLTAFREKLHQTPAPVSRHFRALVISILCIIVLLLGVIVIAAFSSSSPSMPTVTVPAASYTATPTLSPTPASETSTSVATASPAQLNHQLLTRPASGYTLLVGTSVDVELSYNEVGPFDLQLLYDADKLTISHISQTCLRLTALQSGEAEVHYFDGTETRTFQVEMLARPTLNMLTPESDVLMFSPEQNGGTLFLPKGTSVQLLVDGLHDYTLQVTREGNACTDVSIRADNDGHILDLTATAEGEASLTIATGHLQLCTLTVTVTSHAVTSELLSEYHLYEGCDLPLNLSFTDAEAIDLVHDVTCTSDCVSFAPDSDGSLLLHAVKAGVADITIGGQMTRVTVEALPTLQGDDRLTASRSGETYTLNLRKGDTAVLTLQGLSNALPVQLICSENAPVSEVSGTQVSICADTAGSYVYTFTSLDQQLFVVKLQVEESGLITQFDAHYDLYLNGDNAFPFCAPLSFVNDDFTDLSDTLRVEGSSIHAELSGNTASDYALLITPIQEGVSVVLIDDQTFEVQVHAADVSLTADVEFALEDGVHTLCITEGDTATLTVNGLPENYTLYSVVAQSADICKFTLDGHQVALTGLTAGDPANFALWATDQAYVDVPLFECQISVLPRCALTNDFAQLYALFPGETLEIPVAYLNGRTFTPDIVIENASIASASIDAGTLTLTGLSVGETTITADGKAFTAFVMPHPTLSGNGLVASGDSYTLKIDTAQTITLDMQGWDDSFTCIAPDNFEHITLEMQNDHQLSIRGVSVGREDIRICSCNASDELFPILTVNVTVKEPSHVVNTFEESYDLLVGSERTIALTFSDNAVFKPEITVEDESLLSVQYSDARLDLTPLQPGQTTVTVDDYAFTVNILSRALPVSDRLTTIGNNAYSLDLYSGETITLDYTVTEPGYQVRCISNSSQTRIIAKMLEQADDHFTLNAVEEGTYTFYGIATLPGGSTDTLFSLTVYVLPPQLTTQFDFSYTMMLGETCYIPLTSTGHTPDISVSCSTMTAYIQDACLYLVASAEGQHTVSVRLGDDQQTFYVNVTNPVAVFYQDAIVLPKDADGCYLLSMPSDSTALVSLSAPGIVDSLVLQAPSLHSISIARTFSSTYACTIVSSETLDQAAEVQVYATLPETRGETALHSTDERLYLCTLYVTVQDVWSLSDMMVSTLDDDVSTVMYNVCSALKTLGLLKGDVELHAARAIESDGTLRTDIWTMMQEARSLYGGFSNESYYTQEDYLLLVDIAQQYAAMQAEQTAATPTPIPQQQDTGDKQQFYIVDAAADESSIYLLDEDGYVIQYDRTLTVQQQVWEEHDFTLISGNGSRVLLEQANTNYLLFGSFTDTLTEALDNCATDISAAALAQDSLLLLLGDDGIFAIEDDKRLNPNGEDMFLEEGQAVYFWSDSDTAMGASVARDSTAAANILMTAAGDNTIAILCDNNGVQTFYLKSTARSTGLSKKVGTLNQSGRVFVKVDAALGSSKTAINAASIAVSDDNLAVVQQDGSVYILGTNDSYQCGTGATRDRQYFQQVLTGEDQPLTNVVQVILMDGYTLLLDRNGQIWICGSCDGIDYRYARMLPGLSSTVSKMVHISATQILIIDYNGQIMLLENGQPTKNGTFLNVQR